MLRVRMGSLDCCREDRDGLGAAGSGEAPEAARGSPGAWEILTMLALIAVKPALISAMLMETLQAPKWKILSPAVGSKFTQQDMEKRQRNKGDPLMAAAWESCPRKRIFLIIFLINTTVIHMKYTHFI